jgi:hypothetical protein
VLSAETTPRRVYAANVVAEVVKKNPAAWFWTGETTLIVRLCDALLPRTFWVSNESRGEHALLIEDWDSLLTLQ